MHITRVAWVRRSSGRLAVLWHRNRRSLRSESKYEVAVSRQSFRWIIPANRARGSVTIKKQRNEVWIQKRYLLPLRPRFGAPTSNIFDISSLHARAKRKIPLPRQLVWFRGNVRAITPRTSRMPSPGVFKNFEVSKQRNLPKYPGIPAPGLSQKFTITLKKKSALNSMKEGSYK